MTSAPRAAQAVFQLAVHGPQSPAQHGNVSAAFGVRVGVGKEAPLGWHPGIPSSSITASSPEGNGLLQTVGSGQFLAETLEGPALN